MVIHSLNPVTDFHQIFRGCLPQEDLELIRFFFFFLGGGGGGGGGGIQWQLLPW